MKKLSLSLILVLLLLPFVGCRHRGSVVETSPGYGTKASPQQVQVPQQQVSLSFVGEWVISNWQERGTLTLKHDGKVVKISEQNGIYFIESPDWFFNDAKFRISRQNVLAGNYVATFEDLTDMFSHMPEEVLKQAAASRSVVYSGSLVMLRDGRIAAERSNCQISHSREGRFSHSTPFPGWIKFTLTKK